MHALGIDIGGTGIKGAPVDTATGKLLAERTKIDTPHPATPEAVTEVVRQLVTSFSWTGAIGCTFPGVVAEGTVLTAANMDPAWIGTDAAAAFGKAIGSPVTVLNDADAAGVAEVAFGAGNGEQGTVLLLTFGTSCPAMNSALPMPVPNTEFGHIEIGGHDAEKRASERAKVLHDLSWKHWAGRVDDYLQHMEALVWPKLIIIGGGISKQHDKFVPLLKGLRAEIVPAALLNDAGIVGAAMSAGVANPSS
jgi:polyphosphate glucokinase